MDSQILATGDELPKEAQRMALYLPIRTIGAFTGIGAVFADRFPYRAHDHVLVSCDRAERNGRPMLRIEKSRMPSQSLKLVTRNEVHGNTEL